MSKDQRIKDLQERIYRYVGENKQLKAELDLLKSPTIHTMNLCKCRKRYKLPSEKVCKVCKIEQLKNYIKLHAGDCESLRTEVDMFREKCDELEESLARSGALLADTESKLDKATELANGNHKACYRLAKENDDLQADNAQLVILLDVERDRVQELRAEKQTYADDNAELRVCYTEMNAKIAELGAEPLSHKWISVEDRSPEVGQNVLIFGPERNHGVPFSCIWSKHSRHIFNTHWKPITLPPKKEQEQDNE